MWQNRLTMGGYALWLLTSVAFIPILNDSWWRIIPYIGLASWATTTWEMIRAKSGKNAPVNK